MTRMIAFAAAAVLAAVPLTAQQNTTTVLIGRVVVREGGQPLPYASVTINGKNAQFSDSTGRFVIEGLSSGDVTVRARRIGFTPAQVTAKISRGDTTRVTLQMTRIAIQLPAMYASAKTCRNPGAPGRNADPALVQLYDQLLQNAEHFRLLSTTYPYVYSSERQFVTTYKDSVLERTPMETLAGSSAHAWKYEPGKMVFENSTTSVTNMHLPTLATFAEESFAKAHCFEYGGVVDVDGTTLIKVDFLPDDRIKEPDVSGSFYLDPKSYQIRRSDIVLSKVPYALSGQMLGHTVTTYFTEVVPGVPIIGAFRADVLKLRDGEVRTEMQRVVEVHFINARPE